MNVLQQFGLGGKVAVVTGAAGLVGKQIARALAEAGACTILTSRQRAKVEPLANELTDRGLRSFAAEVDQRDEQSVARLLAQVASDHGGQVHIVVNNAVLRPMKDWGDPSSQFAESMAVNATGIFHMCRAFGDHMAASGGGSIINIGSIQGVVGPDTSLYEGLNWGSPPDYFFHKAGMIGLTRYVAARLGPRGVRCNCISPGGFFSEQDQRFVQRYNARTFLGRMANATDLQGAVVFLASDASAYVTGINLPVDGGYTSK